MYTHAYAQTCVCKQCFNNDNDGNAAATTTTTTTPTTTTTTTNDNNTINHATNNCYCDFIRRAPTEAVRAQAPSSIKIH